MIFHSIKSCILFSLILVLSNNASAKTDSTLKDSTSIKKGWNFGVLPAISFDTDLGFQYGGLVNAYYFGDGSRFPKYNHSLYFEISRTTKGSGINRFFYDSDRLIKNCRFSIDVSYLNDQAFSFYGFNGRQANYNNDYIDSKNSAYKTRMFYAFNRNLLRIEPVIQKSILKKIKLIFGIGIYNYDISNVNIDKLNKGKSEANKLPDSVGLFQKYKEWGIISSKNADGGWFNHLILGLAYDSRDNEANPTKGIRDEVLVGIAPTFFGNNTSSAKITAIHRQYLTIVKRKLTFCYRLLWQANKGDMPWYANQLILKSYPLGAYSEGVGGAKTVRGILRYRLVGRDFAFGNFEFRYLFPSRKIIKQNFQIGLNWFYDAGIVTRFIPIDYSKVSNSDLTTYFANKKTDNLHQGIGMGLRIIMNQNFIVAFEYGHALKNSDGISGFYINLNYLF